MTNTLSSKIQKLLNEKWLATKKMIPFGRIAEYPIEFFIDPTSSDIDEIIKTSKESSRDGDVRLGVENNGNLYAWDGDFVHSDVEKELKKTFVVKFSWSSYQKDRMFIDDRIKNVEKVQEEAIKKIKKLFPMVNRLENHQGKVIRI